MAWNFEPPGFTTDFSDPQRWHSRMQSISEQIIESLVAQVLGKDSRDVTPAEIKNLQGDLGYVNPVQETPPAAAKPVNIQAWGGFPQAVERRDWSDIASVFDPVDPTGQLRAVEQLGHEDYGRGDFIDGENAQLSLPVRHRQDEYLEWEVGNDGRSVAFVTEGYDYFAELFRHDEQGVVDIYKEFTKNDAITADDLRAKRGILFRSDRGEFDVVAGIGEFNPRNRFNIQDGIVHLSHRANSLGAEVFLAGESALARTKFDGSILDGADAEELLCCNRGGAPNRNSDPIISKAAYAQVLLGNRYTLSNPVGLYIASVDFDGLLLPGDTDPVPREWWHEVRGSGLDDITTSRVLRLELRIPDKEMFDGRPMRLTDLRIEGGQLMYPGQLAKLISVHLFVTPWKRESDGTGPSVPCRGTCCVLPGDPLLYPTIRGRPCGGNFSDKFPGLIQPDPDALLLADGRMLGRTVRDVITRRT